jgi:peroxiredoxin (alkyl hydroperoxide reductase subunit C)
MLSSGRANPPGEPPLLVSSAKKLKRPDARNPVPLTSHNPVVISAALKNQNKRSEKMSDQVVALQVGQQVPEFKLDVYEPLSKDFQEITLSGLLKAKKWVVLFFYPADFTFVCPTELADLAEKYAALQKLGVEVISVSTDTKFVHMAWQRDEKLLEKVRYPMGADPTGVVSRLFGVYDAASGLDYRGTFVISPDGKLVSAEVNFLNVGRNCDELFRKVEANTYLAGHPGEVCPAKWAPGRKTLKPSAAMVGKVHEALHG